MKTVDLALDILEYVANNEIPKITPKEIAQKLGINHSSVVRILKTFAARGYLRQDGVRGGYSCGPVLTAYGFVENEYKHIVTAAIKPLNELSDAAGGKLVNISVLNGNRRILLYHTGHTDRLLIYAFGIKKWYFWENATEQLLLSSLSEKQLNNVVDQNGLPERFDSQQELSEYLKKVFTERCVIFFGEKHQRWILGGLIVVPDYPAASIGFAVDTEEEAKHLLPSVRKCIRTIEHNLMPDEPQFF